MWATLTTGLKLMVITPIDNGLFKVEIPDWQIQIFHNLAQELKAIISDGNSHFTTRLFPVAYQSDKDANDEYQSSHMKIFAIHTLLPYKIN